MAFVTCNMCECCGLEKRTQRPLCKVCNYQVHLLVKSISHILAFYSEDIKKYILEHLEELLEEEENGQLLHNTKHN